jgi:hypothetical protein
MGQALRPVNIFGRTKTGSAAFAAGPSIARDRQTMRARLKEAPC